MISLIMTVLNERQQLPAWFESFKGQTSKPDEVVIVDGGSTDGTFAYLKEITVNHPFIKVFQKKGNIAQGRNSAIGSAQGQIIVVTDAGCIYAKTWLEKIVAPLKNGTTQFAATAFAPWFLGSDIILVYAIAVATIPQVNEFKKDWLPSSRSVAFTKGLWHTVGGYPEWIPYCEDVLFDKEIIKKVGQPIFVREPLVFWKPRNSLGNYFKQLYNYTRSEGHGQLNFGRQMIRYVVYFFTIVCCYLTFAKSVLYLLPVVVGGAIYSFKFLERWFAFTTEKKYIFRIAGLAVVPAVVALGDVAKMIGYLIGKIERAAGAVNKNKV